MARRFQDGNFLHWEAYASTGPFGYPERPHIVFNCLTDKTIRPRYMERPGEEPELARWVEAAPDTELRDLLEHARALA